MQDHPGPLHPGLSGTLLFRAVSDHVQVVMFIVFTVLMLVWFTMAIANVALPLGQVVMSATCNKLGLIARLCLMIQLLLMCPPCPWAEHTLFSCSCR